jgi:hypothetical protein
MTTSALHCDYVLWHNPTGRINKVKGIMGNNQSYPTCIIVIVIAKKVAV